MKFLISHYIFPMDSCFFFSLSAMVTAYEEGWWTDGWSEKPPELQRTPPSCPFCKHKEFKTDYFLFEHIRAKHTNMPRRWECRSPCRYGADRLGNFKRHVATCKTQLKLKGLPTPPPPPPSSSEDSSEDSDSSDSG